MFLFVSNSFSCVSTMYVCHCFTLFLFLYNVVFYLLSQNTAPALIFSLLVSPESMTWRGGSGRMKTLVTSMRTWWTWRPSSLPSSSRTMRRAARAKTRMMPEVHLIYRQTDEERDSHWSLFWLCCCCCLVQMAERGRTWPAPQRNWSWSWRLWTSQMNLLNWRDQTRQKMRNWPKNCWMNKVNTCTFQKHISVLHCDGNCTCLVNTQDFIILRVRSDN